MVDADLGEVVGPDVEGLAIRHRERKVIQILVCGIVRPTLGSPTLREHNYDLCATVSECDVSDAGVLREGEKSKRGGIPPSARLNIGYKELEVGKAGNRRTGLCLFDHRHATDTSYEARKGRIRLMPSYGSGVEGAKRRGPATNPSSSRPPP
jgi:hypothetical protein